MYHKTDVYRVIRMLDAIRKGFYWQSIDSLDRSRQSEYLRRHMNNVRELEDVSNTSLSLTIFLTSILLSILQLVQSVFGQLETSYALPLVLIYVIVLVSILLRSHSRKARSLKAMRVLEEEVTKHLDKDFLDIKESELLDSIQIHLIELSLLDEIGEEALSGLRSGSVGEAESERFLGLVVEKADAVHMSIDQKRRKLAELRATMQEDDSGE